MILAEIGYNVTLWSGRFSVVTAIRAAEGKDASNGVRWMADSDARKGTTSYPAGY